MNYSAKNLTIGFDGLNTDNTNEVIYATIFYCGFELFRCWKHSKNLKWRDKTNKWELNKGDLAVKYDYTPSQYQFDRIDEMLKFLEKDFCQNYNVKINFIE